MACLGECDDVFPLSVLQKALKANTFSKWLSRIQIAEIEKAAIDGLEQCPFCPFATIMDTTPEENKLFACQNPDCGKGTIFSAEILLLFYPAVFPTLLFRILPIMQRNFAHSSTL